jgi:hypothetical protein
MRNLREDAKVTVIYRHPITNKKETYKGRWTWDYTYLRYLIDFPDKGIAVPWEVFEEVWAGEKLLYSCYKV